MIKRWFLYSGFSVCSCEITPIICNASVKHEPVEAKMIKSRFLYSGFCCMFLSKLRLSFVMHPLNKNW